MSEERDTNEMRRSRSPRSPRRDDDDDGRQSRRRYSDAPRRDDSPRDRRRREDESDDEDTNYELRLLLPAKLLSAAPPEWPKYSDAGAVIGKGGATIKRLRSEYHARINFDSSRTPERVLIVTGNFGALREVVSSVYHAIEDKYRSDRRSSDITAKVLIHQSQAGCVIGRQGAQLKEFRQRFGVDIKVFAQCCPNSTERITQMIGRSGGITKCIIAICKMLNGWPPKGFKSPYDPENYDLETVRDYGGFDDDEGIMGGRFSNNRNRERLYGAAATLSESLASLVPKKTTQKVSIPSDLAGVIIGKGGQKIRQIREDSGAEVELSDNANPGDRIITISGTPDQIQNAQYLLQTCVKQHLALNRKD